MTQEYEPCPWDPSHDSDIPHPSRCQELVGHDGVLSKIFHAWQHHRLGHGLILCGLKGIGKATLAYKVAQFLLHHGITPSLETKKDTPTRFTDIPQDSHTIRRILAGSHADFIPLVRKVDVKSQKLQNEISVHTIRSIHSQLNSTSVEGKGRVVLIDSLDDMNINAKNALLKTLEEPPKNTLLIMIAHTSWNIIPTILSRSQKINLSPLSQDDISILLKKNNLDTNLEIFPLILALSMRSYGHIHKLMTKPAQKVILHFIELLTKVPKKDIPAEHAFADMFNRQNGDDMFYIFQDITYWWLNHLGKKYIQTAQKKDLFQGESRIVHIFKKHHPQAHWFEVWEKLTYLFDQTTRVNLDKKQTALITMKEITSL